MERYRHSEEDVPSGRIPEFMDELTARKLCKELKLGRLTRVLQ